MKVLLTGATGYIGKRILPVLVDMGYHVICCTRDKNKIAGDEILTYKDMLLGFASLRGLKRYIGTVPLMTPKLSSYWLYFITSTSYKLAISLVDSMKVIVTAQNQEINNLLKTTKKYTHRASTDDGFMMAAYNLTHNMKIVGAEKLKASLKNL